ncbi:MAG: hypothetical protein ACHP7N_04930 [Caulobacterales bacterium]
MGEEQVWNRQPKAVEGFMRTDQFKQAIAKWRGQGLMGLLAVMALAFGASPARAVPAFAVQTGQPCQACHIGGFGPQLTAYGREFKIGGYTTRSGSFNVPLSVMAVASFVHTQKDQPPPPPPGFGVNDNVPLDQVSVFFAGGFGSHFGAFVQTTYDGIGKAFTWDNTDLRAVTTTQIGGANVVLGASLNNNPTVQDVWNTTPAWGFPYTGSALAPGGGASPMISGALAQTSIGLTGYAWINSEIYLEGGAYWSPSASALTHLGADPFGFGSIRGGAPYGRVAFQKKFDTSNFEIGAFIMQADIYPMRIQDSGTDGYLDVGVDGSYQQTLANSDVITFNARYINEQQTLNASSSEEIGAAANDKNSLNEVRADASYYWHNKIGFTVQGFSDTGSADEGLYGGNRTLKPDTSGVMLQVDGTPWGAGNSPFGARFNVRVGLQYTAYTQFNGASSNYDGAGANASDNNTLRVFTWIAF